jgi:polysaccharide export outer membrane protein
MDIPAWQRPLQRGDRITLRVDISGNPRPDERPDVVDDEGNLNLPLIGRIHVDGRTRSDAQSLIEKAYVDRDIYKNVSVTIIVMEEEFFVDGEVRRPSRNPLRPGMTVMQAIAAAGGPSEYADKTDVQISRGDQIIRVNATRIGDGKDKDIVLKAGDRVTVGRKLFL